jgi:hypothetical protein
MPKSISGQVRTRKKADNMPTTSAKRTVDERSVVKTERKVSSRVLRPVPELTVGQFAFHGGLAKSGNAFSLENAVTLYAVPDSLRHGNLARYFEESPRFTPAGALVAVRDALKAAGR